MQTIKKVILVVICLVVLLTSLILPSGAVDQDMLDEGWIYENDTDSYYLPSWYSDYMISPLILSEPNVTTFDPSKIPFYEAPKYITDIVYMTLESSSSATDYVNYKVPFVCVFTGGSRVRVIVGINIALASYFSSSSTFNGLYIISSPNFGSYSYSVCYDAWFDVNTYEITTPWTQLPAAAVGSSGRIVRYTGSLGNDNSFADYYLYGGNGLKLGDASSVSVTVESDSSYPRFQWPQNQKLGFNSGVFISPSSVMTTSYFSTFTPVTSEQVEAETQKGILNSIKELPSKIADSISSLFDKLINYLLYFQETKPEHVNSFADILTDVKSFFNEQMSDVGDFKNSLSSTLNNVVTYIETGSGVVNTFLTAVPMLSAFITFFVVFCIVRKVIGR